MTASDSDATGSERGQRAFLTTRWSVVVLAGRNSSPDSRRALASLCETYWYPLYAYARRRVNDVNEAQDLTQAFFAELLEKNYVGSAEQQRGRFRAYLLTAFKHFLAKQWEMAKAQKRGGGRVPLSLDFAAADSRIDLAPPSGLTPEQLYQRQWAVTLLEQILERLAGECERDGKSKQFEMLKGFIVGDRGRTTYADVAAELNMTEAAAKMAGSRLRRRYRELLRDEISQTVAEPDDVDDEIRNLFATLEL